MKMLSASVGHCQNGEKRKGNTSGHWDERTLGPLTENIY